ncbi:MAG: RsmE family RNA methyltransferase [Alteromonas naphthalenivorans]
MKDNKHEFALYYPELSLQKQKKEFSITDQPLIQRIVSVLRLKQGDILTLFDQRIHVQGKLGACSKKSCSLLVENWHENIHIEPGITVLLPLLKRDAIELAIYSCVALGATTIQLVHTEKTRKWQGDKELDRLIRIIIAAAEQSKHFIFPTINMPIDLVSALEKYQQIPYKLFAEPNGKKLLKVLEQCDSKQEFVLLVGPEGDLTSSEKELLSKEFVSCRLTPTILKSEQALALLLGTVRLAT